MKTFGLFRTESCKLSLSKFEKERGRYPGPVFACTLLHFTIVLQDKFLSGDMKMRPDSSIISCDPNVLRIPSSSFNITLNYSSTSINN